MAFVLNRSNNHYPLTTKISHHNLLYTCVWPDTLIGFRAFFIDFFENHIKIKIFNNQIPKLWSFI